MATLPLPNISGRSLHFSTLPVEIRAITYQHLFSEANLLTQTIFNSRNRVDPVRISKTTSILRVNRQCYMEALPLFYDHATFTMRNVSGWRAASYSSSLSPWTGPTTARIRNLVITRSTAPCRAPLLGDIFPSLRCVTIEVFGRPPHTLSITPPAKAKINLATTVLMLYDHLHRQKLHMMRAQPFHGILLKITDDPRDWWMGIELWRRIISGEGKGQYKMCLKVDLTDAIPWVKRDYPHTGAASCCAGGSVVGFYNPDNQMWTFTVNGRQIIVPELLDML